MKFIRDWLISLGCRRAPDFIVGGADDPYMRRWWLIPRNRFFNVYLHQFLRDDDDRALHDHPWWSLSWMLSGAVWELTNKYPRRIEVGEWRLRTAEMAHRLEIPGKLRGDTWTLFITGPVIRAWGFHCPQGWVPWEQFTDKRDKGAVGAGCGEA